MKRSLHNLSYTKLLSCDMGELIPIGLLEVLPGDSIQMQSRALIRCAPMLAPPMHPCKVRIHHFFVPNRIVWESWEDFITGGPDGMDSHTVPVISIPVGGVTQGTVMDYYGFPVGALAASMGCNALPARGYNLIWNEYYRDQDLQSKLQEVTSDANSGLPALQRVSWPKDYYTVARPWEQKGPIVTIPIGGNGATSALQVVQVREATTTGALRTIERGGSGLGAPLQVNESGGAAGIDLTFSIPAGQPVGVSASSVTVNALRQSLAIQRFEEARAMYGARYVEYLRALGVMSSDARLQRPEYLGGGSQTIQFSEVMQTAQDGTNPVGTLRGHGINAMRSNRFRRFFEEHGYIHSFMSIVPKAIYQDGAPRHFQKSTKFDYWQRELENIGQQAIQNREVYAKAAVPHGTFGWADRYQEYRFTNSQVAGEFTQSSLNYWHFSRIFASEPALNSSFVSCVPPERAFAAPSVDVIYAQIHHSVQARRLVAAKAIPRTF